MRHESPTTRWLALVLKLHEMSQLLAVTLKPERRPPPGNLPRVETRAPAQVGVDCLSLWLVIVHRLDPFDVVGLGEVLIRRERLRLAFDPSINHWF